MFSAEKLQFILQSQTKITRYVVAYSGGLDSHVLLHAMSQQENMTIEAVHVNHQLNEKAHQWVLHCQNVCKALSIPLHVHTVSIDCKPGDSLEEQARNARYDVLKQYVDKNRVLLTAHTMTDQAETFLLQALRGSGVLGLSAMPEKKALAEGFHLRPLLSFTRENLEAYAQKHALQWVNDDSNVDTRFDRNFLRHEIFAVLKKRFPSVVANFTRCAQLAAESQALIAENIETLYQQIKTSDVKKIQLAVLLSFSPEKQRLLLRYWLAQNNVRMPSQVQLHQIQKDVLGASQNADPIFELGVARIRRYRSHLYLVFPNTQVVGPFNKDNQVIRTRRPSDRVKLPGQPYSQSLKNYFQSKGIPPWERDRILLVFEEGICVGLYSTPH